MPNCRRPDAAKVVDHHDIWCRSSRKRHQFEHGSRATFRSLATGAGRNTRSDQPLRPVFAPRSGKADTGARNPLAVAGSSREKRCSAVSSDVSSRPTVSGPPAHAESCIQFGAEIQWAQLVWLTFVLVNPRTGLPTHRLMVPTRRLFNLQRIFRCIPRRMYCMAAVCQVTKF